MDFHPYFDRSRNRHPHVTREIAEEIATSYEHEETQDDGRIRRWGYSENLEKHIRVILLPDGETILNVFPDRENRVTRLHMRENV